MSNARSDARGKGLPRRSAVLGLAGAALAAAAPSATGASPNGDFALELLPPLRSRSAASGIKFGCAGAAPIVHPDAIMLETMATEANIFIPEGHLKWEHTEPRPSEFDFDGPDSIVDYAARHDMIMHGHTLVWYAAIPDWVAQIATARDAQAAL